MDALTTTELSKTYGSSTVVDAMNLRVPEGSVFGFLGPNGAGKTTTMKMILGLISPTSGSGEVLGLDMVAESADVRRRVGYLPQEPRFYGHMTARETLAFAASFFFSGPGARIDRRIDEMLELVGLTDKADRPIKGFSGGEMQRLGIAQAQIHGPELLILDEPAAALDPLGRRDVLSILSDLRDRCTVFYSTHILDDVERVADSVCILNAGQVVAQGRIGEILHTDAGPSFSVTIEGDAEATRLRLAREPWITDVVIEEGGATLVIRIDDAIGSSRELQQLLLDDEDLIVKDFRTSATRLEDVFMNLVEGNKHDS